ncbi:MAG TPA: UvrD-helicase domain-containing protein [Streptosporangiaceae bacterium]|nr:UvrD-helicase domain-containing protein [Streptosporangiaceae bacterium]
MFHADLHIHSRYSRACSQDCDIEHLAWWALRKGITVVGTGDFTHPAWAADLRESLIPAEPGLLRLRPGLEDRLRRTSPRSCAGQVRFMLSAEISTIYRGGDRTRKVHHLLYAPTFEAADRITTALGKTGNLASDGRPILGLDSRNLLEITLSGGPGCYLVPAHAWTPWFAVLGSKSGFDLVADCYGDLADEVFAIETGLSSDPPMNWMCSALDRYRLVSNSDAHSPPMLGREATTLTCDLDYFAIAEAFRSGSGLHATIEFFPEEGRYHLDGHRKCGIRFEPGQSSQQGGICPACARPLTIGVAHRVAELADRPAGYRPAGAPGFAHLIQLRQVVAEIVGTGPASKKVMAETSRLVSALGPELGILSEVPLTEVGRAGGSVLAEALGRLRRGKAVREAGFDGEYGTVRLFQPGELDSGPALFDLPAGLPAAPRPRPAARKAGRPVPPAVPAVPPARQEPGPVLAAAPGGEPDAGGPAGRLLSGLDPEQRSAALAPAPLLIIAGPGAGKTRTLTHRIAYQVAAGAAPASCLALTFTRRAAEEMRARLAALSREPDHGEPDHGITGLGAVTVTTFHGLGLRILRELHEHAGLPADFRVADEAAVLAVAAQAAGSQQAGRELLRAASPGSPARATLVRELTSRGLVDFDGLIEVPASLLAAGPGLAAAMRDRWKLISVDEYQDIDAAQYQLLQLLAGDGTGLTAIGDPDQAIYGFRGADVGFFLRFGTDYPGTATRRLSVSYRASHEIVAAATAAIAPATLVPGRTLRAVTAGPPVSTHEAADEHAEAAWIARAIDQLLGGSSFHSLDSGRAGPDGHAGLSLAGIAILYRTDAQSAALGQALTRAGLPFRKGSHDLLQRRPGVPELLAEMRLAAPGSPPPAASGGSGGPIAARLASAARALATRPGRYQPVDILAAGELLTPLARRCGDDTERFWTEVSLGAAVDALDPRADVITLLTLHASKGLEFDVVFVAGCEDGLLPLRLPDTDLAEDRRLLFVGMTRARSRLVLTYAAARQRGSRGGAGTVTGASPFLRSLGPVLAAEPVPPRPRRPADRQLRLL